MAVDLYDLAEGFRLAGFNKAEVHPRTGFLMVRATSRSLQVGWDGEQENPRLAFAMVGMMRKAGYLHFRHGQRADGEHYFVASEDSKGAVGVPRYGFGPTHVQAVAATFIKAMKPLSVYLQADEDLANASRNEGGNENA